MYDDSGAGVYGPLLSLFRARKHCTCRYLRPVLVYLDHVKRQNFRVGFVANDWSICKAPYATPVLRKLANIYLKSIRFPEMCITTSLSAVAMSGNSFLF